MSEHAEQTSGKSGSTGAGPIVPNSSISKPSDSKSFTAAAAADPTPVSAEAPSLVPAQNAAGEAPKIEAAKDCQG